MIICGIDPGYARSGYAFINSENNVLSVISYGLISTHKSQDFSERLYELGNDMESLFKRYQPSHVYLEKIYMGRNTTTVLPVSEVRGILRYLIYKNNIQLQEISPSSVKKIVSGYGAADKSQMIRAITLLLDLPSPPHPDDVADALSIAFCGAIQIG